MTTLILGLIIFFGVHSISIFARPLRNTLFTQSPMAWKAGFSVFALIGLTLMIMGYGEARLTPTVIYAPPAWTRHLVMLLMIPVFPLIIASILPSKIKTALKHPLLVATKLWALSHLIANGMLADILLFGAFLCWAVITRISVKRRNEVLPATPVRPINDVIAIVLGLVLYGAFVVWGHALFIGVSLIPQ